MWGEGRGEGEAGIANNEDMNPPLRPFSSIPPQILTALEEVHECLAPHLGTRIRLIASSLLLAFDQEEGMEHKAELKWKLIDMAHVSLFPPQGDDAGYTKGLMNLRDIVSTLG